MKLEWRRGNRGLHDYWLVSPTGEATELIGWCDRYMWLNLLAETKGEDGDLRANKAACEDSVKQSIRELAAWVEQEEQA